MKNIKIKERKIMKENSNSMTFGKGEKLPEQFSKVFNKEVHLKFLVDYKSELNCPIANVTFEPGCINNWHKHPGGQILLVTMGRGYYQEFGQKPRELFAGDVVEIPENVKHWHGAAKDSEFVHLSIETNRDKGNVEWLEPVDINQYNKLK
jgi:quercetin dioxygenase-like cupin family protein